MFHKQYYSLEEAANKLGTGIDEILHEHSIGKLKIFLLCDTAIPVIKYLNYEKCIEKFNALLLEEKIKPDLIFLDNYINEIKDKEIVQLYHETKPRGRYDKKTLLFINLWVKKIALGVDFCGKPFVILLPGGVYEIANQKQYVFKKNKDGSLTNPALIIDGNVHFYDPNNSEKYVYIPFDWVVMTHEELTRLLALKAEQDNKPTYEQLQAENEALKKQLAEIQESKNETTLEINPKSKSSINAFFKALNSAYPNLDKQKIANKSEELGVTISDKTIYKYLSEGV